MSTFSEEHTAYLKKRKKEKRLVFLFQFLIIASFLIGWELLARFEIINTFLTSSPSEVMKTIYHLFQDGSLFTHIGVTLYEVFLSFTIATVVGLIVAILLWSNKTVAKVINPYLTILNSLPKVALGPLIIIWVGASVNSIIFMALLISTFVTIINIYQGFSHTDNSYITLLKSFKASKRQIFFKAVLPSNFSTLINALTINISMSLIGS